MAINKDYEKYEFLNSNSFVISNLENSLTTKRSRHENKVFSIIMAGVAITILVYVLSVGTLMQVANLHPGVTALIYVSIATAIIWRIVAQVKYHIDDIIRDRTTHGEGNVKFDLSNAWKITPGGIEEDVDIGLGKRNGSLIVNYDTKAIFLKGIMRGTVDGENGDDLQHYTSLQRLLDVCFNNGYEVIRINMPYNTENDPIWDIEADKIYKASELGEEYLRLRSQLHETVYDFTKKNSTVTVTYFILKAGLSSRLNPAAMAMEVIKLRKYCLMEFTGVSMQEMKSLMESYYGVVISIEDILAFMTTTSTSLGECKIISYTLPSGDVVKQNDVFAYAIPSLFLQGELTNSFTYVPEEEIVQIKESIPDSMLNQDIFSRDFI